jgi:quinol monooxygenase YgiN
MFDVIVTQKIESGREAEAEEILRELSAATLALDTGCVRYEWYRSETRGTYVLIGRWTDEAAARVHVQATHTTTALLKLADCADEKFRMTRLAVLT